MFLNGKSRMAIANTPATTRDEDQGAYAAAVSVGPCISTQDDDSG